MKKFFSIAFTVIAALILVSCSGKNLDDLIDVADTDDTADSSVTPDQNDTDNGGDTDADTTDDADTSDTEPTEPTESTEPTEPTGNTGNDSENPDNDAEPTDDTEPVDDTELADDTESDDSAESDNDTETDDDTEPTTEPTADPSDDPTSEPTDSTEPTTEPTTDPTTEPTTDPTTDPSDDPSNDPSDDPTTDPTDNPTTDPTTEPTVQDDTQRCTEITLNNTELTYKDHNSSLSYRFDLFKTALTTNIGSATTDNFYLRLFGSEYNYSGNHELAGTNWKDDDGCSSGVFLYVYADEYCDSYSGSCSHGKTYFQKAGTVNVTSAQINSGQMYILYAELNGVVLEEVTINSIGESAPVEQGSCLKIQNNTQVEYHGYYY